MENLPYYQRRYMAKPEFIIIPPEFCEIGRVFTIRLADIVNYKNAKDYMFQRRGLLAINRIDPKDRYVLRRTNYVLNPHECQSPPAEIDVVVKFQVAWLEGVSDQLFT